VEYAVAEQRNRYLTQQESSDLGFGSVVSNQPRLRLLNRNGSFNVVKSNSQWLRRVSGYHRLLTMSWPVFFSMVLLFYVGINLVFAVGYYLLGPDALQAISKPRILYATSFSAFTLSPRSVTATSFRSE
jgi:inward rectifier potassium channel